MIVIAPARASELVALGQQNNPFFAWDNLGIGKSYGGSATIAGGAAANAFTGSTYDKWRPVTGLVTRSLIVDFVTPITITFAAMAAHNLASVGGNVRVQNSPDNLTWTDAGAGLVTPTDNDPIAWRMAAAGTARRYWRFLFTLPSTSTEIGVGVFFFGNELIVPRRFYQGFSPVITPTEVQLQSNVSVGNELLGSSVIGRGSNLSTTISNIDASFIRGASWIGFQRHFNDGKGSFFGWRPNKYPQDIHYIWRSGPVIRPNNAGPRDLMQIELEAQVHNART